MTAGKSSSEKLVWTDQCSKDFKNAKESLKTIKDTYYPMPDDQIHTFSDFSQDCVELFGGGNLLVVFVKKR